ncbi:MAG: methyltransferase domain-containing protein [Polyangiaceae bacterium]|nr:methyltransferase domain-containing protein [Polyangiaceae bacterium]
MNKIAQSLLLLAALSCGCRSSERPSEAASEPRVAEPASRPVEEASAVDRDLQQQVQDQALAEEQSETTQPEETKEPAPQSKTPDVVYVPTPQPVVDKMLQMAQVKKGDVVYDLGCGDGRIVVTAAKKYGARAYGFDVDPKRIEEAKRNVEQAGVGDLVSIQQADIFTLDLSDADVVTLYLLPELNVRLIPQLQKLKKGARIVSHDFDMAGVAPLHQVAMKPVDEPREHSIFMWRAPIKRAAQTEAITAR